MCMNPFNACYNPKTYVCQHVRLATVTDLTAQSLRPLLQPTARNISVHMCRRLSVEGDRINQGLAVRQIIRTFKACGHKEKVLIP